MVRSTTQQLCTKAIAMRGCESIQNLPHFACPANEKTMTYKAKFVKMSLFFEYFHSLSVLPPGK